MKNVQKENPVRDFLFYFLLSVYSTTLRKIGLYFLNLNLTPESFFLFLRVKYM